MSRIEDATEQLYGLLPAYIATEDAARGYPLKAFISVLAAGSAEIDAEIDALYDSQFVETAADDALEDIAALIGAETLRPLPPGSGYSRRAFIGNTMRYRRGKGTARVLEALAADVGGTGAAVVEYFMRLARTQNLIDVRPERPGTASLVPGETRSRAGTAFDRLPRLVDVRSIARAGGRHHVPHVGIHLLRPLVPVFAAPLDDDDLSPAGLAGVPVAAPWSSGSNPPPPGYYRLAAQPDRMLRLFNPDRRADAPGRPGESDLPDRLRRLPLHLELEERRRAALEKRAAELDGTPWFGPHGEPFTIFLRRDGAAAFERVPPEQVLIANLDAMPATAKRPAETKQYDWFDGAPDAAAPRSKAHPIRCGFDPQTGRLIVAEPAAGAPDVVEVRVAYATGIGRESGAGPYNRDGEEVPSDIVDTTSLTNRVWVVGGDEAPTSRVANAATLAEALAGWALAVTETPGIRGFIVLTRCDRERLADVATQFEIALPAGAELHITSARWVGNRERPGVPINHERLGSIVRQRRRFTVDGRVRVNASAAGSSGGVLVLDGLELTQGLQLAVRATRRLHIRYCTIRAPGRGAAISTTAAINGGYIEIDRSLIGRIGLDFGGAPAAASLSITASIVSVDEASGPSPSALSAASFDACLRDVTVLGTSSFASLEATNVIFADRAEVTRSQAGCVRFSSIAPLSAMPRRFRCQPDLAIAAARQRKGSALTADERAAVVRSVTPVFLDTSLDEPTVAMLHPLCADAIRTGGEGDTEMGVFSAGAEGQRMANLNSLFDDYVPFGLEAGLIDDTRSSAVATRRNVP